MRRAVAAVVAAAVLSAAPAGAIETDTFGIAADERSSGDPHRRVRLEVAPGGESAIHLRVWNKTATPLALMLEAMPATIPADGAPVLGGDGRALSWISLDADEITLGPRRQRIVTLRVEAPSGASGSHPVAVVATPVTAEPAPAVVERVGVVVELVAGTTPVSPPARESGRLSLLAVVVALGLLGGAGTGMWRHRHRAGDLGLGPLGNAQVAYAAGAPTRAAEEHPHGAHRPDGVRNATRARQARRSLVPRRPVRPPARRPAPPRSTPAA